MTIEILQICNQIENLTNFLYNGFQFSQQQQNILLTELSLLSETDLLAGHRATNYLLTPAAHLNLTHHFTRYPKKFEDWLK